MQIADFNLLLHRSQSGIVINWRILRLCEILLFFKLSYLNVLAKTQSRKEGVYCGGNRFVPG